MGDWHGNVGGLLAGDDIAYELPEAACVAMGIGFFEEVVRG